MSHYPALLFLSGLLKDRRHPLSEICRIGRHPNSDLQIIHATISRSHSLIETTDKGWRIRDLDSLNGTWVNGNPIRETVLKNGDEIRLGNVRMQFIHELPENKTFVAGKLKAFPANTSIRIRDKTTSHPQMFSMYPPEMSDVPGLSDDHLSRLQALYQANLILSNETDLEKAFHRILEHLLEFLKADRGVLLLHEAGSSDVRIRYSLIRSGTSGRSGANGSGEDFLVSRTIVDRVFRERMGLLIDDAREDRRFNPNDSIAYQGIRSALCVPVIHSGETLGAIYLDSIGTTSAFSKDDLQMLTAMAAPAAVQIRNLQYLEKLSLAYLDTIRGLANAIEARDAYTVGHTKRVTRILLTLADNLSWSPKQKKQAEMGGILHDIGKIGVEDAVLRKQGILTESEFEKMRLHPEFGAKMIKDIGFLQPVIPYISYHHERWDGKGYPHGIQGRDIPIEGRLIAVPDAFDAMTSHRPYRKNLTPQEAKREIVRHRGTQFDPDVVDLFVELFNKGEIRPE